MEFIKEGNKYFIKKEVKQLNKVATPLKGEYYVFETKLFKFLGYDYDTNKVLQDVESKQELTLNC